MPAKPSGRKSVIIGVSVMPDVREWVVARAAQGNLSLSAYVASLVDGDRRLNLLPEILQTRLEDAPPKKGGRP